MIRWLTLTWCPNLVHCSHFEGVNLIRILIISDNHQGDHEERFRSHLCNIIIIDITYITHHHNCSNICSIKQIIGLYQIMTEKFYRKRLKICHNEGRISSVSLDHLKRLPDQYQNDKTCKIIMIMIIVIIMIIMIIVIIIIMITLCSAQSAPSPSSTWMR